MTNRIITIGLGFVLAVAASGCSEKNVGNGSVLLGVKTFPLFAGDVARIAVTVSGPDIHPNIVVELNKDPDKGWSGLIEGIPSGNTRMFVAKAFDGENLPIYTGSAKEVTIVAAKTQQVVIMMYQDAVPEPFENAAPRFESIVLSETQLAPGGRVKLAAMAIDPEDENLTYKWISDDGDFSHTNIPITTWTAPANEGTYTLTVTANDPLNATATVSFEIKAISNFGNGSAEVVIDINTWPTVASLIPNPSRIDVEEITSLDLTALDADGDTLTYLWSKDCEGIFSDASAEDPSFTLKADNEGMDCTLRVRIFDNRGGANTAAISIATGPDITDTDTDTDADTVSDSDSYIPARPGNLEATINRDDTVTLAWTDNSENEAGFRIREKRGGTSFMLIGEVEMNTTSFNIATPLAEFEETCYEVLAYNLFGESDSSEDSCITALRRIHGLNFGPYEGNQNPNWGAQIPGDQMIRKIKGVRPYCNWIRTFGTTGGLEVAGELAHEHNLKIAMGAWLDEDQATNSEQMNNLIAACNRGEVDLAIVGSEVLLRNDLTAEQLIEYIEQFKEAVPDVPVTYGDVYDQLIANPEVMAACDVIMGNFYPFWEGVHIDSAMQYVNLNFARLQTAAGGKEVIISETGWPSGGELRDDAEPSPKNAAYFFMNLISWAEKKNLKIFYFEAYDEPWKAQYEMSYGDNWGIMFESGELKPGMIDTFMGERLEDNWTGTIPGGPGDPEILHTFVPAIGSTDNLRGQVWHVSTAEHFITVYIRVGSTWWVKPYWNRIRTPIQRDGSFIVDITTGGSDTSASKVISFLFEESYTPPTSGSYSSLPQEVYDNALAHVLSER